MHVCRPSGQCAAGYYCTANSTSAVQNKCGATLGSAAASVYCKSGSSNFTFASEGYYTVGGNSSFERTGQLICEFGHYCEAGVRYLCPYGRYGSTTGLSSPLCSGVCADGYLCPNGSVVAMSDPCPIGSYCIGGFQYFCPAGTYSDVERLSSPDDCTRCPAGFYNPDVNGCERDAVLRCFW
jgi:hypothetical protein